MLWFNYNCKMCLYISSTCFHHPPQNFFTHYFGAKIHSSALRLLKNPNSFKHKCQGKCAGFGSNDRYGDLFKNTFSRVSTIMLNNSIQNVFQLVAYLLIPFMCTIAHHPEEAEFSSPARPHYLWQQVIYIFCLHLQDYKLTY